MAATTTKAWTYSRGGLPREALSLTHSHSVPAFPPPGCTEPWLLLAVSHAALNPGDVVTMAVLPAALVRPSGPARTAAVPGYDLTATVLEACYPDTETGTDARRVFSAGDDIVAFVTFDWMRTRGVGGLQGVVAVPARFAVRLPAGRTKREAAGLLLTGCTALQQVRETGVAVGQRVLVHGASGGVGTMAVQMARQAVGAGGMVVGVCSGRNAELVRGLGADEHECLADELARRYGGAPFDTVIDAVGSQALFSRCADFLKADGIYDAASVHYDEYAVGAVLRSGLTLLWNAVRPKSPWLGGTDRRWKAVSMMDPGVEMMEDVVAMFADGRVRVAVDSEWPFEQVLDAYDVVLGGHARGKVVINVGGM